MGILTLRSDMTTQIKYDFTPRVRLPKEKDAVAQKEQIRRVTKTFIDYLKHHRHHANATKFINASEEILAKDDYMERRDQLEYVINLWIEAESEKLVRLLR